MITRESLKEFYMQIAEAPSPSNRWLPEIVCEQVDLIFDELESHTCENCKHSEYFELSECPIDTEVWKRLNKKNFGCNLFVSKDTKIPEQD